MLRKPRSRTPRSDKLFAAASRILPGGVDSPVRAFKSVGATPVFIVRGRGARIEDEDGHTYIDYVMSWGPLIHGHAPRGLLKTLAATAAKGTSFGAPTELETRLAQRVATLMPSMERVRFVSSGTEAAMSAARVARAATKRDKIVKFEGCYHGHADPFLVQAGSGAMTLGVPTSPGVAAAAARDTLLARYNDLDSVERVFARHRGQIAAIFVEPIAGNMGLVPPGDGFLPGLRAVCDREGALLVFDEVISGFRAAAGGAQQIFRIRPDLTCLGKIIGGGLPVGAYGGRADLMGLVAPAGPVYQAGTLSGNPLAMAAGLWSLEELSPGLYTHLAQLGARLAAGLADAARQRGVPLQVNAFGSLLTPFFTDQPVRDYQSALAADTGAYAAFFRGMLARGVYPPPSQFEAWFISGAHTSRDIDKTIAAAREAMRNVEGRK
ncbi:MAG: glutamate-1-semialdehyde-2,1-aminomutase [Acidobacteria bacterium RIFCSPLOWO2_02_FULL_67_36]|nr:MAG: glutamate-1-semialdehyde-2,1-aminomutase [Acidobacteria bacterium RIFCSPLOWO2_02_FULL_67_36]OFW19093.1 MAG: glutamate-1-semialdehyde-2,1-aminomutase [Acidobacteria bacterium RIFCSPLOWO2_12_FULL_66_21]